MTSIVTLLGSAGVAVSLAMQGVLGNLVGGFILLLFKPIRAGEFDNRHINLLNGTLTNTAIVNFTREGTRRLDLNFTVGYEHSIDKVYEILRNVVSGEKEMLENPAPSVYLTKCGDNGLEFSIRVWVTGQNYWPVNFRLLENCRRALDEAGIRVPYQQVDVHMKPTA